MEVHVTLDGTGEVTAEIYRQLLEAVRDGRLAPGGRLPATRDLARRLGVARGTVATAYDRLAAEGFLEARRGAGTFVAARPAPTRTRRAPSGRVVAPLPVWSRLPPPVPDAAPLEFDLSVSGPDTTLFPMAVWRRMVSATLRPSLTTAEVYAGDGHPGLQAEVARHLGLSRSVVAGAEDVLLTTGAQQAVDVVARVLVEPGTVVAVEDPGYTAAVRLLASHGARMRGVPVDAEGIVVDRIPRGTRLVYVTPSHQFPTGAVMSLPRRIALLEWASRNGAVIVEDDYDSEFRFEDRPLEPLQSLDREGHVVYVGSFSKVLMPVLRVGFLVAPSSLQPALQTAKQLTDWQGDVVTQGALARFMAEGQLAGHVRRTMKVYRERRAALLEGLGGIRGLRVLPSVAGLHVATELVDQGRSDTELVRVAARSGVGVEPLSPRYVEQEPRQGLLLGFRHVTAERVPAALERLATVVDGP